MVKSKDNLFRFKRGHQKFSQSWDRQKMEERERARERARAAAKQQATIKAEAAASGSETLPPQGEGSRGGAVSAAQKEVK